MRLVITRNEDYNVSSNDRLIISSDIEAEVKFLLEESEFSNSIVIASDSMVDLFFASKHGLRIETSQGEYDFKKLQTYKRNLVLLKHAKDEKTAIDLIHVLADYFAKNNTLMDDDSQIELIKEHALLVSVNNVDISEYIRSAVLSAKEKQYQYVFDLVSINPSFINKSEVVSGCYDHSFARKILSESKKIICLNDKPGSGKTVNGTLKILEEAKRLGLMPIVITGKKSLAKSISINETDYIELANSSDNVKDNLKSLVSVVNTLFSGKFDRLTKKCNILIIEELDDLMSHFKSLAAGKNLDERMKLLKKFLELCGKVDLIVVSDAICGNSVQVLAKQTGLKVDVYTQSECVVRKKTVIVHKSDERVISATSKALEEGNTALMLADCSNNQNHSFFNVMFETFSKIAKTSRFDAAEIKSLGSTDVNKAIADCSCAVISPAINVGVSIIAPRDYIAMVCHGVQNPIQIAQFMHRYRGECSINISLPRSKSVHQSFNTVLAMELENEQAESVISDQLIERYASDKYARILIDRIIYENNLRANFAVNTLIILKILGYDIEYAEATAKIDKRSKVALAEAEHRELARKISFALKSENLTKKQARSLLQNIHILTTEQKYTLYAHEIKSFYGSALFSEEIMQFDSSGKGRRILTHLQMVRDRNITYNAELSIIQKISDDILLKLGVQNGIFLGPVTKEQVLDAYVYIKDGNILSNGRSIKVSSRLNKHIEEFKFSKQQATMINYVLNSLFDVKISQTQNRDKNRNMLYEFKLGVRHNKAQEVYKQVFNKK